MKRKRLSNERGQVDAGWLKSAHSFSFGHYYDPTQMGYRSLRVINEDHIAPGKGFGEHPHQNMEIITVVLSGELAHGDSMGNAERLVPGEVQCMSAGRGVRHSEFNASDSEHVHLLQIWILPARNGTEPTYRQKRFSFLEELNRLHPVVSSDGAEGALVIGQDVRLSVGVFEEGQGCEVEVGEGRGAWIQVAEGEIQVAGERLSAGDALMIESESPVGVKALERAQFLWFDLG